MAEIVSYEARWDEQAEVSKDAADMYGQDDQDQGEQDGD